MSTAGQRTAGQRSKQRTIYDARPATSSPHDAGDPEEALLSRQVVPPALYLPTTGASTAWGAEILLHQTTDGRLALLAYTALDRLARCMGPHQPWVLYPTDRLGDLDAAQPYQVIYLDQALPREVWRQPGHQEQQGQAGTQTQASQPAQQTRPAQAQPAWPADQPARPADQPAWPTAPVSWREVAR